MRGNHRVLAVAGSLALTVALGLTACGGSSSGGSSTTPAAAGNVAGGPKHIFFIAMENHQTNQIIGNTADAPYINSLTSQANVAMKYYGVTHPSLPNYLAMVSGDYQNIWDDCGTGAYITCPPEEFTKDNDYTNHTQLLTDQQFQSASAQPHLFDTKNLVDLLEAKNLTWKGYFENLPGAGYTGDSNAHSLYAGKHNPFIYFKDIRSNPQRMNKIVPWTQFTDDLNSGKVPNFAFMAPNQCDDQHGLSTANATAENLLDCAYPASGLDHSTIKHGDTFLSQLIPSIMKSSAWNDNSAIVIWYDENDYSGYAGCCHSPVGVNGAVLGGDNAPLLVITKSGSHTMDTTQSYNHYSLLATIEKMWGLPCIKNECGFSDSELMTKFFQ